MNAPTGIIDIRGKQYQTVALRVQNFREKHPDYGIITDILIRDDDCVVIRATITDATGRTLATGHSEEYRKSSQINRTSALENAETSALGRALAALGFGGTEFASANEVENAIHQQQGGHSQGGAVSPPAKRQREPGEPPKTHLDAAQKRIVRQVLSCGDQDMLRVYLETAEYKEDKAKLEQWRPWALYGPVPESEPEEYEPIKHMIGRLWKELEAQDAQAEPNILQAG